MDDIKEIKVLHSDSEAKEYLEKIICGKCEYENESNDNFCGKCGQKLNDICPNCLQNNYKSFSCGFEKCKDYLATISYTSVSEPQ